MRVVNTSQGYQIKLVDSVNEQDEFINGPSRKKRRLFLPRKKPQVQEKNTLTNHVVQGQ